VFTLVSEDVIFPNGFHGDVIISLKSNPSDVTR